MSFATTNPATGEVEKTFDDHTDEEVEARLARAAATFDRFRRTSFAERARLLTTAAELLEGEIPDIARVLTTEMGKTFASAKGEAAKCASAMRWFAEHAEAMLTDEEVAVDASLGLVTYQPLGAVLAIMPWNFPLWQVVRFAAPALMVGNVGLLKHASNVPQTALYLEGLFRRAGYPEGAFTTLLIGSGDVAKVIADDRVVAVTLTGSERAGQSVASAAGEALKKCVLELGGSDPFVVLGSADLDRAVSVAVQARVQNNGQSCIAAKRFIVEASVYDEFTARFTEAMAALTVGDPLDPATDVGPLVSAAQREEIAGQVDDARDKGAVVGCGGDIPDGPGWYYPPTVLTGVTPAMRVFEEETFGPVAVVERAADLDEAIDLANRTSFGLGSSAWTTDPAEQARCIDEIEAGQVFVNAMVASTPEMPFGGIKRSGYGRELSALGIKEFCNAKGIWVA
ncbi:MAG TPA: NADP-dependent succinic semialdehyde dehydrogenase [Acidimicrobiales bacterium]|nr:NADP-dependent succinic semialdehyde dehydrogenase [Acidimicrobiales bacterium]